MAIRGPMGRTSITTILGTVPMDSMAARLRSGLLQRGAEKRDTVTLAFTAMERAAPRAGEAAIQQVQVVQQNKRKSLWNNRITMSHPARFRGRVLQGKMALSRSVGRPRRFSATVH